MLNTTTRTLALFMAASIALGAGCKSASEDIKKTEDVKETTTEGSPESMSSGEESTGPLQAALEHPGRTDNEKARDVYRNPAATLEFFGVEPTSSVLELWSGRGWYTHVLAPYLANQGKLYVTAYSSDEAIEPKEFRREMTAQMRDYLDAHGFAQSVGLVTVDTNALDFGLEDEVDVVLTFRNIHNWVAGDYDRTIYELSFKALKPGGTFGVVEHRGPEGMTREQSSSSGYMDQAQVIRDIEAVGFEFVGSSEVNANPKDTKDYEKGVWTLPPALTRGEEDRDKYLAIGESDRMTLKFIKPSK